VEKVWLDEFHGFQSSTSGHDGKKPVSTINLSQNKHALQGKTLSDRLEVLSKGPPPGGHFE
jgi:hypothetical protein